MSKSKGTAEWKELKKEFWGQNVTVDRQEWGYIDFSPQGMNEVFGGEKLSYEEYLDVQMATGKGIRGWFALCHREVPLNCMEADYMNFDLMAERTRYLKENPKGVSEMCKALEDMRNEAVERTALQMIRNLMETMKWSADQAMAAMKIPEADQSKYADKL